MQTNRRIFVLYGAATLAACGSPASAAALTVYKSPACGCCTAWAEHMRMSGFPDIKIIERQDLDAVRASARIPAQYASCHTGFVGGYAIEGHVPAADVKRLLKERPDAIGLAVPGMPTGSPGMESPDGSREPYATLLIGRDGTARVFDRHGPAPRR